MDGQIEQKLKNPVSKPPRESFGDPFGDAFDFSELDKTIAARKPKIIVKAQEPTYRVDMSQFELPPFDFKVWNRRVLDHDRSDNTFSRYRVVAVINETSSYTMAILVKSWCNELSEVDAIKTITHRPSSSSRKLTRTLDDKVGEGWAFLRVEWYHTPIQSGDSMNLCSLSGRYETNLEALPINSRADKFFVLALF